MDLFVATGDCNQFSEPPQVLFQISCRIYKFSTLGISIDLTEKTWGLGMPPVILQRGTAGTAGADVESLAGLSASCECQVPCMAQSHVGPKVHGLKFKFQIEKTMENIIYILPNV